MKQKKNQKREKPPQGYYFGEYESEFEKQLKQKEQIPGVGQYNLENSQMLNSNVSNKKNISLPQSKRFQVYDPQTPGPNQYKVLPTLNNNLYNSQYKTQQTQSTKQNTQNTFQSTFFSTSKRTDNIFGIMNQSNVGPGQYDLPSSFNNKKLDNTPNFKLYEQRKFKLLDTDVPGVGQYNIPEEKDHILAKFNQGDKDFHKLVTSKSQVLNPGVGTYHNPDLSDFVYKKNNKGTVFGHEQRKTFREANKDTPGPTAYNLPSEDKYKFNRSLQYSISTYKSSMLNQQNEYAPGPFDYQDRIDDDQLNYKSISFQQSTRPDYELQNITPGIGTYDIAQDLKKKSQNQIKKEFENKNMSDKLQKVLISKKPEENVVDQFGQIRSKKQKHTIVKKQKLIDYAQKQKLDKKQINKYLKQNMSAQELERFFSPHPGEYNFKDSIQIKRVGQGETLQGTSYRKLEYLDVYNAPQFGERSQGPAHYSKIESMVQPNKKEMYTIFRSQKQSFVPKTTTSEEVGVGKYNDKEFSTFGKYKKQVEKIENFKRLDYQKKQFLSKVEMEKKSKQYAKEKQKEEQLQAQQQSLTALKTPKLSIQQNNSQTDIKFNETSQTFIEQK